MMTRQVHRRNWGISAAGITVHPPAGWYQGAIETRGELPLRLPPPVVQMDPSDPTTWRRPVRHT